MARSGRFDLILMDIKMPRMDGVTATRAIREMQGHPATTPIVALTANVLAHQRQSYLEAGMDGVVGKPIAPGALVAVILGWGPVAALVMGGSSNLGRACAEALAAEGANLLLVARGIGRWTRDALSVLDEGTAEALP